MKDTLFRQIVAQALELTGDTNEKLSTNLGASIETIRTYRKGRGDLKGVVLKNLVEKYGFNPAWLLAGEGEMYASDEPKGLRSLGNKGASIMKSIIEAVEERLLRLKIKLKPDKKAEVITALYDYFVETGKEISQDTVERYLRLAA